MMKKRMMAAMLALALVFTSIPVSTQPVEAAEATQNEIQENKTGGLESAKLYHAPDEVFAKAKSTIESDEEELRNSGSAVYNSEWDKYSSNYIYNRLSGKERQFWDAMDAMALKILTSTLDLTVMRPIGGDDYAIYDAEILMLADYGLSVDRAVELAQMFNYANPQYYFLQAGLVSDANETMVVLAAYSEFADGYTRETATANFKKGINAMLSKMNTLSKQQGNSSDAWKEIVLHDFIADKMTYDHNYGTSYQDNPFHQSAYSVFCDDHTVCAGYTKAYSMLLNACNIDAVAVLSTGHAWNKVKINNAWYNVDITWDDTDYEGDFADRCAIYMCFNRSDNVIINGLGDFYVGAQPADHTALGFLKGLMPTATKDSGATAYSSGTISSVQGKAAQPKITITEAKSGYTRVTLSTTTSGAEIYYTVNGKTPNVNYNRAYKYSGSIKLTKGCTLKAVAVKDGYQDSSVAVQKITVKPITYTVSFDSNGGSKVTSQSVVKNSKAKMPKAPTRKNYVFGGWYTNAKCTKAYDFNKKVTSNIKLYAKWYKAVKIYFDGNGGTPAKKNMYVGKGGQYTNLPTAKRKGYIFQGWYTKKSGGTKIKNSDKVKISKATKYYAHWKKISIKQATISSLSSKKAGQLTIITKKLSGVDGYEIKYSLKSNMKSAKKVKSKSNGVIMVNMKKGKKYYVMVRGYKKDSAGKYVYGKWSSVKSKTVKK